MKITNIEVNSENLHFPKITLEDGSFRYVHTRILKAVYRFDNFNITTLIGEEFEEEKIAKILKAIKEYEKTIKKSNPHPKIRLSVNEIINNKVKQ